MENCAFKHEKAICDLEFLKTCKAYETLPKFLYFKLYRKQLHHSKLYKSWQYKLLNIEITSKNKLIKNLKCKHDKLCMDFENIVSRLDLTWLKSYINVNVNKRIQLVKIRQSRKLSNLGINNSLTPLDPNKVIFNYSSRILTDKEKNLLAFGLSFCLPIFKINFFNYFLSFEKLYNILKKETCFGQRENPSLKSQLHNLAYKLFYNFKPKKVFSPFISKSDINILKSLSRDDSITICRPDKGRGVVILDKSNYISKMEEILSDYTKFKEIKHNNNLKLTLQQEDKVNRLVRTLTKDNLFSEATASQLKISGSSPGIMYGLPKIHKNNIPLRPILSANNTSMYNIAKFLVPILSHLTTNEYTVKNSFEFSENIINVNNSSKYIMSSFDIVSLFTNIPLEETINICLNKLFNNTSLYKGFSKKQFKNLLEISSKNIMFFFNGKLYQQIDGVAMGSPLGPTLANIFLCHWEKIWLEDCPIDIKPHYYKRYVDDTFMLFENENQIEKFKEYLNNKHKNIKFTVDSESNNSLSFLDVKITKQNNKFVTSLFRKATFTGLGTHFLSYCPQIYKINTIKTLVFRAFNISSTYFNFHLEISFLKNYFVTNGYPSNLFYNVLYKFLNNIYFPKQNKISVEKKVIYIKLPYYGYISQKIKNVINRLTSEMYPQINLKIVFSNKLTISSFFKHKESLQSDMCSSVIYKFTCACNAQYIGSTARQLRCRISEHMGISVRTQLPLNSQITSSILEHSKQHFHQITYDNFKIITKTNNSDLRLLESMYINKFKPNLNEGLPVDLNIL